MTNHRGPDSKKSLIVRLGGVPLNPDRPDFTSLGHPSNPRRVNCHDCPNPNILHCCRNSVVEGSDPCLKRLRRHPPGFRRN